MAYVIKNTAGEQLTIVNDGTIDQTTSLTLVGRNYSNFGQIINENFVQLLENFADTTPPTNPITGQLWYDSTNKKLKIYNGSLFTGLPQLISSNTQPSTQSNGDMWYNTGEQKLYVYDGSSYNLIGPQFTGISGLNSIVPAKVTDTTGVSHYVLKHNVENILTGLVETIAITAADPFTLPSGSITGFTYIKRGINLYNSLGNGISVKGNTTTDTLIWGTAQSALSLSDSNGNLIPVSNFVTVSNPQISNTLLTTNTATDIGSSLVPFRNIYSTNIGDNSNPIQTVYSVNLGSSSTPIQTIYATTNIATYADLAERYRADALYDEGTVLVVGGEFEVTICRTYQNESVAGIVSINPAYAMNEDLGPPNLAPYIALKGRVPCKVKGPVKKGDLLITSDFPGHAESKKPGDPYIGIIGKALQDFDGQWGKIEVMV
jgi:hypothetical protein